jgi:hypothetical protein
MLRAVDLILPMLLGLARAAWGGDCAGTVYLTLDTGNMAQAEEISRTARASWPNSSRDERWKGQRR